MQEGPISGDEFQVPSFCPEKPDPSVTSRFHKNTGGLAKMRALLPNAHYGAPQHALLPPSPSFGIIYVMLSTSSVRAGPCWRSGREMFRPGTHGSPPKQGMCG